ncbi:MAG TPA: succinate dehydrogenase, hydrophobic membrane anchor protein [Afifellaceae bacterium]|nr:succinate dehydrogenase, hydrophobic membrane anchor protein [Afifellaceae bacterium]
MRTPLGQVRGLGAGRSGTGHFIAQRLTSIAGIILGIAFVILIVALAGSPYEEARGVLASPLVAILLLATIINTIVHMRIGMQVIIEDYVHGELAKFAMLAGNWIVAWAIGLTAIFAVLKLAFGG